jgi:hypothetical protein
MLSHDKRQQIERVGAREVERFHRDIRPTTFASIIDDIRHKVVEEGWYGRQVTENIGDARDSYDQTHELSHEISDASSLHSGPVTGWGTEGPGGTPVELGPKPAEQKPLEPKPPGAGL